MTNVVKLQRMGLIQNVIDHRRQVNSSDFVPSKRPEFFAEKSVGIVFDVATGVSVAASISQPNVVASISEDKACETIG